MKTTQLTQKKLADLLGFTQGRISRLLKLGMPRDPEAAEIWLQQNAQRSVGGQSLRRQAKMQLKQGCPNMPSDAELSADGLDGLRARAQASEQMAYGQMREAYDSKNHGMLGILARSHAIAVRSRIDAENQIAEHKRTTGTLVPMAQALETIDQALSDLASQLNNFPRNVAAAANPSAPDIAETAIRTALDAIRNQICDRLLAVSSAPPATASAAGAT